MHPSFWPFVSQPSLPGSFPGFPRRPARPRRFRFCLTGLPRLPASFPLPGSSRYCLSPLFPPCSTRACSLFLRLRLVTASVHHRHTPQRRPTPLYTTHSTLLPARIPPTTTPPPGQTP
ncbi:hypothetical protein HNY73_013161 [Argiope bruennichi]|uniref:Uncharacterized protein n=1 Tax=Argiope bruennichi TaxID=94029 RepID=A0A8T0EXV0_ARGBR|nr:hypothetical protein HNY73_013161 [Argiope bruennichi]